MEKKPNKQKTLQISNNGVLAISNNSPNRASFTSISTLKNQPKKRYTGKNQVFADEIGGGESVSEDDVEIKLVDTSENGEEVASSVEGQEDQLDELLPSSEEDNTKDLIKISQQKKQQRFLTSSHSNNQPQLQAEASGSGTKNGIVIDVKECENNDWGSPISESSNNKPHIAPPSPLFFPNPSLSPSLSKAATILSESDEQGKNLIKEVIRKELEEKATTPVEPDGIVVEDSEEEEEEEVVASKRSAKKHKVIILDMEVDEDDNEEEEVAKLPAPKKPTFLPFQSRSQSRLVIPAREMTTVSDEELMGNATFAVIVTSPRKRLAKKITSKRIVSITIPDAESDSEDIPLRRTKSTLTKKKKKKSTQSNSNSSRTGSVVVITSDEDSENVQAKKPLPKSSALPFSSKRRHIPTSPSSSSSEEPLATLSQKRRLPPPPTKKTKRVVSDSPSPPPGRNNEASLSKSVAPSAKPMKRKPKLHIPKNQVQRYSSGDDSSSPNSSSYDTDTDNQPSSKRRKNQATSPKKRGKSSKSVPKKVTSRKVAPSQKLSQIVKKARARDSADEDSSDPDDFINDDVDDDDEMRSEPSRRSRSVEGKGKSNRKKEEKKSKLMKKDVKGKGKARRITSDEEEDEGKEDVSSDGENEDVEIQDEDLDLGISGKNNVISNRFRNTQKESKFDKLRAMRNKTSGASSQPPQFLGDNRVESESEEDASSHYDESCSSGHRDVNETLKNFIVSEEEEEEDPEQAEIVQEFLQSISNQAQGRKFYLKTYVQWIIREIVCPEIEWLTHEKSYADAYSQCLKTFKGIVNSLVGSSAWKKPFKKAIDSLPEFVLSDLPDVHRGVACDACTSGAHRFSTFQLSLGGDPYDPKTFKTFTGYSSDEDDDSESDISEFNEKFVREFNLGSNCAGRAATYSELTHFGYLIYNELFEILTAERKLFPKLLLPNTATKKQRAAEEMRRAELNEKEAERLTNLLEKNGTITRITDEWIRRIETAQTDFADQKA